MATSRATALGPSTFQLSLSSHCDRNNASFSRQTGRASLLATWHLRRKPATILFCGCGQRSGAPGYTLWRDDVLGGWRSIVPESRPAAWVKKSRQGLQLVSRTSKGRGKLFTICALDDNDTGKEDVPQAKGPGPGFSERWKRRFNLNKASTSYDLGGSSQARAPSAHFEISDDRSCEDGSVQNWEEEEEELGDYESSRRMQYRADVERGAQGLASVFRAFENSVSWGVSTTGRGLTAIQTGVQGRFRKKAQEARQPEPARARDPDSLGNSDSESDSEWDGSEPEVLLADAGPAAVMDPEVYSRQQGEASTSGENGRSEDTWEEPWETIKRWWNNPAFFRFRVSLSMANLTMALPAFIARVSAMYPTFVTGLHSQLLTRLSLPIMAPLLFGGGIAFKAIMSNLGFVLPRLAVVGGVLWVLWAANYAMQEAIAHLRNSGAIDRRISNVLVLTVELVASTIGLVTILSSVGVKIASLLLPGFAAVALAGKDVWHNYFAGFFLFAAQPFRPGDSVALLCGAGGSPGTPASGVPPGWFEGVCESVDLRYTVLRNGRQRLLVPNSHFVNREFLVTDAGPMVARPAKIRTDPSRGVKSGRTGGTNGPPPQPGMPVQKVAPNGREKSGGFFPTLASSLGPGQMPSGPGVPSPHGK